MLKESCAIFCEGPYPWATAPLTNNGLILVHTVNLKLMIKERYLVTRARKRAPHWGVQSRFRVIESEASETLSGLFNRESYNIYILWYVQILFL